MLVYQRVNVLIIVDHCGSVNFKHCLKMFLSVWVMFKWKMDHVKHQLYSHLHTVDCLLFLIVVDNYYCLSPDFSCSIPHAPTSDLYCLYHLGCAPTYWTIPASFWCIVGHIYIYQSILMMDSTIPTYTRTVYPITLLVEEKS